MAARKKLLLASTDLPSVANVLEIAAIFLLVAWLLGCLAGYTGEGAIHLLLAAGVVLIACRWLHHLRRK